MTCHTWPARSVPFVVVSTCPAHSINSSNLNRDTRVGSRHDYVDLNFFWAPESQSFSIGILEVFW